MAASSYRLQAYSYRPLLQRHGPGEVLAMGSCWEVPTFPRLPEVAVVRAHICRAANLAGLAVHLLAKLLP